jgi:hypothetical protein
MGTLVMGTDGEVEVGTLQGEGFCVMQGGSETIGVRLGFVHIGMPGMEQLLT